MKEITTTITINAPIAAVWQTLMNHQAYAEWNPFIRELKGDVRVGKQLEVTIQPPGQKAMRFRPRVKVLQAEREFRWLGHLFFPGLFDGEHYFILESKGSEQTQFIHGEQFRGIFSGLLLRMIGASTKAGFMAMNEALKQRTETLQGRVSTLA